VCTERRATATCKRGFYQTKKNVLNIKDQLFFPVLMASTGSNFEAVIADKNTINQLRQLIQYLKEYITILEQIQNQNLSQTKRPTHTAQTDNSTNH
jgi:hypothetical protein